MHPVNIAAVENAYNEEIDQSYCIRGNSCIRKTGTNCTTGTVYGSKWECDTAKSLPQISREVKEDVSDTKVSIGGLNASNPIY